MKLNIYCIYRQETTLSYSSNDMIDEIILYKILSKFANVFYNNQLFIPDEKDFGIKNIPISLPDKIYDLYYVRDNQNILDKLPNPKIYYYIPYNNYVNVTALVTSTKTCKYKLAKREISQDIIGFIDYLNILTPIPKRILSFEQSFENIFKPNLQFHSKTAEYKKLFKGNSSLPSFIIGINHNLSTSNFPYSLLHIMPDIYDKYSEKINIKIVLPSHPLTTKYKNEKYISFVSDIFNYHDMPYILSAYDTIFIGDRTNQSHYNGDRFTLEAMASGIPIICGDTDVKKEQLKDDYDLFWHYVPNNNRISIYTEEQIYKYLCKLISDIHYRKYISNKLIDRSNQYKIDTVAERTEKEIKFII